MAAAVYINSQPAHVFENHHESHCKSKNGLPELHSNTGSALKPDTLGWMRESSSSLPLEELKTRFREDGYIFIKGLIPRKDVLDVREHYFKFMQDTGILKPKTSPRDGIYNAEDKPGMHSGIGSFALRDQPELQKKLIGAHCMPEYLQFLEHPALRGFIKAFMEWKDDILLQRTMIRHAVPGSPSTGIHYDQIYLRGGNPKDEFLTAWVPMGDIAADGGGLIYLEDSSRTGRALEADFMDRAEGFTVEERISAFNANMMVDGALSQDAVGYGREVGPGKMWLVSNYEAGDVVFHDPFMIHGAAMNQDRDGRIRLSTDLRFYGEGMDLDKRWMKVWTPGDGL